MIETIICCTVFGVFIIYAFIKGVQIGQKIIIGEKVKGKNPITTIKEHHESTKIERKTREETQEIEKILENIDNYDGTGLGQKDI